jgi:hypothetical protein
VAPLQSQMKKQRRWNLSSPTDVGLTRLFVCAVIGPFFLRIINYRKMLYIIFSFDNSFIYAFMLSSHALFTFN